MTKHDQTASNKEPNGKMFSHPTIFDGVWSPTFTDCPGLKGFKS